MILCMNDYRTEKQTFISKEKEVNLNIPFHKNGYEIRRLDYDEKCSSVKTILQEIIL